MRNLHWPIAAFLFAAAPLFSLEIQSGFEYWDLSFFSPSRIYRVMTAGASGKHNFSFEYLRTDRFGFEDNTFSGTWSRKEGGWGWDLQTSVTPSADVMFRHGETLTLYLPPWIKGVETYAGVGLRRYNESRIIWAFSGLRCYLLKGLDAGLRGARNRTQLVHSVSSTQWSNAWAAEAGYSPRDWLRLYAWRSGWKEFFESGRVDSGAFKSFENGAGLLWRHGTITLRLSHALEKRSTDSSIHKTSLNAGKVF